MESSTDPKIWGPHYWYVMKNAAHNYDPSLGNRQYYINFYKSLAQIIPCPKCRSNYFALMERFPLENFLDQRVSLINWVDIIYNETQVEINQSKNIQQKVVVGKKVSKKVIKKQVKKPKRIIKNKLVNINTKPIINIPSPNNQILSNVIKPIQQTLSPLNNTSSIHNNNIPQQINNNLIYNQALNNYHNFNYQNFNHPNKSGGCPCGK